MTYKYFNDKEVATFKLDPAFWQVLDFIRQFTDEPFIITSGYRPPDHPLEKGRETPGAHTKGLAVDLRVLTNQSRFNILEAVFRSGINIFIEVAKDHIHLDIDNTIHTMNQVYLP